MALLYFNNEIACSCSSATLTWERSFFFILQIIVIQCWNHHKIIPLHFDDRINFTSRNQAFFHRATNISKFFRNNCTWKKDSVRGTPFGLEMEYWNPFAAVCIHTKNEQCMCHGLCFNFPFHVLRPISVNIRKYITLFGVFRSVPSCQWFLFFSLSLVIFIHSRWNT